jgi:hypothetical protein
MTTEPEYQSWTSRGFQKDPSNSSRVQHAPYGDDDFIAFGYDVVFNVVPLSRGVVIDTSRGVYLLVGLAEYQETWKVVFVHRW